MILIFVGAVAMCGEAGAEVANQPLGPTPEQRAACEADADKFCLGPDDRRIVDCLRRHHDELSEPCRKLIDANKKK
jgi:hypothetical protein